MARPALDGLDALGEAAPIIPVGGELARALDDGAEGGELRGLDGTGSMPTGSTSTARARPGAR